MAQIKITHAKTTLSIRIQGTTLVPSLIFEPVVFGVKGLRNRLLSQRDSHHVQQSAKRILWRVRSPTLRFQRRTGRDHWRHEPVYG